MQAPETQGRIITCILPKGKGLAIVKALHEKGITRANVAFARGFDIHDQDDEKKGFPVEVEKEIVTIIAKDQSEGNELFDFVFEEGNINHLGGGLMFMSQLSGSVPYLLPELNN